MNDQPSPMDADEDYTVRLLRLAGSRVSVSGERTARVRAAVRPHWRAAIRRRVIRRRGLAGTVLLAAAAALIVLIYGRNPVDHSGTRPARLVAVVDGVDGTPRRATGNASAGPGGVLSLNDSVRTGEWIETDGRARVALRFAAGSSVRLDIGSRARPLSPTVIELSSGAVYVDTGRASGQFEVRTAMATAYDVGTQFEVRLIDRTLRLRVRTGLVELKSSGRSVSGRGGTEVTFSAAGTVSRPIAPHGSEWGWMASLAPPVNMEGRALSAFLEHLAHEHGWQVRYADPALARETSEIVLHGSVNGLSPREALDIAITTSGLQYRLEDGRLSVFRDPR